MASAEGGSVSSGVGSSRPGGLGNVMSSPSGVRGRPGRSPQAENGFWCILKAIEVRMLLLYLYDKSEGDNLH